MNKTVLDSGFYAIDSGYRHWIPAPFSEELRFRIPTSCSQFTNWGVKKLIASCFTEIFFLSFFFFFWKLRHRITADSKQWYARLLVQDITTQFGLFSRPPSTPLFILNQGFNKGDNPGLLNWPNFLRIAPLFQWPFSPRRHSLSYWKF